MGRTLVLGAGLAGLTAAYTIQRLDPDEEVVVVEAHPYPGGLAATMEWQGCRMDLGPHRIYTEIPGIKEMIHNLVGGDLVCCRRTSQLYLQGKWMEYPLRPADCLRKLGLGNALGMAASAVAGRFSSARKRVRKQTTVNYADYLQYRFGRKLREILFDPFAYKVYQTPPEELDAQIARVRLPRGGFFQTAIETLLGLNQSAVKTFLYPSSGMGLLANRLVEAITNNSGRVLLNQRVTRLRHTGGLVRSVDVQDSEGVRQTLDADRMITTIPINDLVSVIEPRPPQSVRQAADELFFADALLVYNLVDRQPLTNNCWMYFPDEDIIFSRIFELYHFSPLLVPDHQSCLCAEIPLAAADPRALMDEEDIKSRVWEDFQRTGLARNATCLDQVVLRVPKAYPIYRLGYAEHLGCIFDYLAGLGNLVSTGRNGLFHYNNCDHTMEMGRLSAENLLDQTTDPAAWYQSRDQFDRFRIVD